MKSNKELINANSVNGFSVIIVSTKRKILK